MSLSNELISQLRDTLGPGGFIDDPVAIEHYTRDERDLFSGLTPIVLRPQTTKVLASAVKLCTDAGVAIVPQGGNTGYCGGSVPDNSGKQVLISLSRMNQIRHIDPLNYTMVVEAGCVLADLQSAADEADRLFPLSLGAEGSCQIGGNLSTNAGGVAVLKYGNAGELVLGLEVVLPDGRIWNGLRELRKDNTGYDLKRLFLGAEGTLGIITAAALKLFPKPREVMTALVATRSAADATSLLAQLRSATADSVTSFEYMHRNCIDLVLEHIEGVTDPFPDRYEHYVLIELSSGRRDGGLSIIAEQAFADALEQDLLSDAVIAQSEAQAQQLWRLRETIPESQKRAGTAVKHDVSVPVSQVSQFMDRAVEICIELVPDARVIRFGHLGDGNVHFNLTQARHGDGRTLREQTDALVTRVHALAVEMNGSFSAEHGIGQLKLPEMLVYKSATELDMMRAIKKAFDPAGLMNPGKVIA